MSSLLFFCCCFMWVWGVEDYLGTAVCCFMWVWGVGITLELLFVVFIVLFFCALVFLRRGDYHFERKFSGWVNYMRVGVMADSKMYHLVKILGYYLGLIKWLLDSLICSKFIFLLAGEQFLARVKLASNLEPTLWETAADWCQSEHPWASLSPGYTCVVDSTWSWRPPLLAWTWRSSTSARLAGCFPSVPHRSGTLYRHALCQSQDLNLPG